MKTDFLRHVAMTLGLSGCGLAAFSTATAQQPGSWQPSAHYAPANASQGRATLLPPTSSTSGGYSGPEVLNAPPAAQSFSVPPSFAATPPTAPWQTAAASQPSQAQRFPNVAAQQPGNTQRWNTFRPVAGSVNPFQMVGGGSTREEIPTPEPMPHSFASPTPPPSNYAPAPAAAGPAMPAAGGHDCQSCNTGHSSVYAQAAQSPWGGAGYSPIGGNGAAVHGASGYGSAAGFGGIAGRPPIYPWFGGFNLLFLNLENNSNQVLSLDNGLPVIWANDVNPDGSLGFDVSLGRYLACGRYGLGVTFFRWAPSDEEHIISGTATNLRPSFQGYHDYFMDLDGAGADPGDQVYNHVTGASGISAGATNIRARRDLEINGIEANLFSFGLMGAQRAAPMCGDGLGAGSGLAGKLGLGGRHCGYGYGGAAGPLVRPCNGRAQVVTSHGFRWFQIRDQAQLAFNIDGTAGYQPTDIYDDMEVENNLFGYQFGGRLVYCLANRLNFSIGGKFGVYGNNVEAQRRVGTETLLAYRFGDTTDVAQTDINDTVLATLGELDLGLGYRVSNAWTIRGGYRVIGASGIATAFGQMSQDFGTSSFPGDVYANESLLLHGAYVGADFNF